jgi:hypothetical protein
MLKFFAFSPLGEYLTGRRIMKAELEYQRQGESSVPVSRSEAELDIRPVPRATYRIQFHRNFRLLQAIELGPDLSELGFSHLYASPLLKAWVLRCFRWN